MTISLQEADRQLEEQAQETTETLNSIVERQNQVADVETVETQKTDIGTVYSVETVEGNGAGILIDDGNIKAVQAYGEEGLDTEVYGEAIEEASEYAVESSFQEFEAIDPEDSPQNASSYEEIMKN